jgi:hypothetical protein
VPVAVFVTVPVWVPMVVVVVVTAARTVHMRLRGPGGRRVAMVVRMAGSMPVRMSVSMAAGGIGAGFGLEGRMLFADDQVHLP